MRLPYAAATKKINSNLSALENSSQENVFRAMAISGDGDRSRFHARILNATKK